MTVPALTLSPAAPDDVDAEVLVLGVRQGDDGPELAADGVLATSLAGIPAAIGLTGAPDELRRVPSPDGIAAGSLAFVGLGRAAGSDAVDALRGAAGAAARQLAGVESLALALPIATAADAAAVLEGAALGAYRYARRGVSPAPSAPPARVVVLDPSGVASADAVERAAILGRAVHDIRDLVTAPPSELYPESFVAAVAELAEGTGVEVEVLREEELATGGFGGILGVGAGSSRGPRLVVVRYRPESPAAHLALVGKGITFDSGGLSLKPAASMVGMKYDMTGAATVLGAVLAAARLALPVRVTAWLCLAENMPSGTAIRPNDVLTIRGGRTVEVLNTDAEGRLVLADGLVAASEEEPDAIVDVATLTGAARVALGTRYVGVMGEQGLVDEVVATARTVGEPMWPMPLPAELRPLLASDVADIANAKPGNTAGGMLLAGVFLSEFVGTRADGERIPWAHLDIAGPANNDGAAYGYTPKGATGIALRTLVALTEGLTRK